jgi:aminoglycoside 3-N-acetyltransferase
MPTESSVVEASREPVTRTRIVDDLQALGVESGSIVIAHASMSALGWVVGAAQTVVEALLAAVGRDGTLVMPAHSSHLSDPALWSNPAVPEEWQQTIRDHMPAFDPALTESRAVGAIAECLRHHPKSIRSPHPLASFVANGAAAKRIVRKHPLTPALGDASPLGRLYQLDALVLLIGVGHNRNTSLHLAEHRADWPSKRQQVEGAPLLQKGRPHWVTYGDLDVDSEDFEIIGKAFARTGDETAGNVAQAHCRLMRQRAIVDFATDWMCRHRQ